MEKYKKVDKFLQVNQLISLDVRSGEKAGLYDSRIEDISRTSLFISMPSDRSGAVPLRENTKLIANFISEGGRYSFNSVVVSRVKGTFPMLEIAKPESITRVELREYFRVETRLKAKLIVKYPTDDGEPEEKVVNAQVADISGGGMRVVTDRHIEKNLEVEVYLKEGIRDLMQIHAKIVRANKIDDKYEGGLSFESLDSATRDKIVKYVFKRQMELRKLLG